MELRLSCTNPSKCLQTIYDVSSRSTCYDVGSSPALVHGPGRTFTQPYGPQLSPLSREQRGLRPLDVIPVQGLGLSRSLSESSMYKYFIALRPQTDLSPVACLWHFVYYIDWEVFPMFWYLDWECNRRFVDKLSCVWASQGPDMGASHQESDLPW